MLRCRAGASRPRRPWKQAHIASAVRSGVLNFCDVGAHCRKTGLWRHAMRRVVALFLPTFPTDQIRRRNPRNLPMVMAMQEGNRRVLTSVDDAARKLKRTYRGAREAAARFAAPAFFR